MENHGRQRSGRTRHLEREIRKVRWSGVKASIAIVHIRIFFKM